MEEVFEKAGGRQKLRHSLAAFYGQARPFSKQTMSDWVRNREIPVKHCPAIQALTKIPLARLNPAFAVKAPKCAQVVTPTYTGPDRRQPAKGA